MTNVSICVNAPVHNHPKSSLAFLRSEVVKLVSLLFTKECLVIVVMVKVVMMLKDVIFLARKNWFCNMLFPAEIIPPCQTVVSHAGPCHAPSHAQVLAHTEPDDCMLLSI